MCELFKYIFVYIKAFYPRRYGNQLCCTVATFVSNPKISQMSFYLKSCNSYQQLCSAI